MDVGIKLKINSLLKIRELFILVVIVIGAVIMSFISPVFSSGANLIAILLGLSIEAIVATGMTLLLISGDMDLSVGSTMAFAGIVTCLLFKLGFSTPAAIMIGLSGGMIIGAVNGLIVTKWEIHPFIVTLGMMSIVRGILLVLSEGSTVINLPENFLFLGQGKIAGIQFPIILVILITIGLDFIVRRTRFFRQAYYIGSNRKAARMTGINVNFVRITGFILCGLLSAFAGIVMASRLGAASVNIGSGLEMKAITASVIGGASLNGGEGSIRGAFVGALLTATLINALNIIGVDVYWQNVVTGIILIVAVVFDSMMQKQIVER